MNSEGLTTTVQPAASAGASFQVVSASGEFHGVMIATTPLASYLRVGEHALLVGRDHLALHLVGEARVVMEVVAEIAHLGRTSAASLPLSRRSISASLSALARMRSARPRSSRPRWLGRLDHEKGGLGVGADRRIHVLEPQRATIAQASPE